MGHVYDVRVSARDVEVEGRHAQVEHNGRQLSPVEIEFERVAEEFPQDLRDQYSRLDGYNEEDKELLFRQSKEAWVNEINVLFRST